MMRKALIAGAIVLMLLLGSIPLALADGGEMVIYTEPADVHLEESEQNAIVAWNKDTKEEIIILSKNLSSSVPVKVLEVVPLPDNPLDVEEADFEAFTTLERLAEEKLPKVPLSRKMMDDGGKESHDREWGRMPIAEVTFHEEIGPHDVTVAKVNTPGEFKEWVEEFCEEKDLGEIRLSEDFSDAVLSYTDKDIKHFVLDVVSTGEENGSVFPILYRFKSNSLFYPMRITAGSDVGGSTAKINLFLVARGVADGADLYAAGFKTTQFGFRENREVKLSEEELSEVDGRLADLFGSGDVYAMNASYEGYLSDMDKDLSLTYFMESPPASSRLLREALVDPIKGEFVEEDDIVKESLTVLLAVLCGTLFFMVIALVFALFYRMKEDSREP